MRFWLSNASDSIVEVQGSSHVDGDHSHFRSEVAAGESFLGLAFDELRKLRWLETDDVGTLIERGNRHD